MSEMTREKLRVRRDKAKLALSEDNVPPYSNRNVDFIQITKDLEPLKYQRKKAMEK